MSTLLATIIADFTTQLASEIAVGGTSATLSSATDDDGVALPSGRYFFTIDGANSRKEHISCDLSGTSLTNIKSVSRQGVETAGVARKHRIGATISITDFAHILQMNALLKGTTNLDSSDPLAYDGVATLTPGSNQLATVVYADGLAIAGSPDSTTSTKGIGRVSAAPADPAIPIFVGDNDARVPTTGENNALVGNNTDIAVGTGNKFVTQTGLQHGAEIYAADAGANDTYAITLSPVPTSYTDGMKFIFKANTANTGAATLNVNSLGAKTIVKGVNTTLVTGDIAAGQICTVVYDGTNLVLMNPTYPVLGAVGSVGNASISGTNVTTTQNIDTVIATTFTPKIITVQYFLKGFSGAGTATYSIGTAVWDGTTIKSNFVLFSGAAGNFTQGTVAVGDTAPSAGGDALNGGWTTSIQSLSATGFTLRLTYTQGSTWNGGDYKACVTATV